MKKIRHIFILAMLTLSATCFAQLNTDRITAIGRNALYFDDYVLSIQYFNQVIKIKPYLSDPYLLRAIAKIQLGDYTGALLDCNRAIELNPFQPGAYYTRGYIYRSTKDFEAAERDFTQALVFAPENKSYIVLRADVRAQQKQYDLALSDIDLLIHREPKSASLLFERGVITLAAGDTLAARKAFEQTTQYDSQNPSNWSAYGMVNLLLNQDDEALLALTQAINLGSKWAGDYINRGVIFYRRHNYRGALTDYDKAIDIEPSDAQCYYNRGVLRQELGDYNHALEDFDKAISLAPEQTEMYYQRATTLMQLRQWQQAIDDFEQLISTYPYFLPSYYLAAQAKTALGDTKGAFLLRQKAADLEKNKEAIQRQAINTDVQVADAQPAKRDRRKEFSSRAAQNQNETDEEQRYSSDSRGAVQKNYVDIVNEPNIVLSYYGQAESLRRTNYTHIIIDAFNRAQTLPSPLRCTVQEVSLTADMVSQHFEQIARLSERIEEFPTPHLYFARAIEFALVQDYISAMDDATRAIKEGQLPKEMEAIVTFCRANWRFKQLQFQRATGELTVESTMDFDIMLRDFDHVTRLYPDFAFAYYNKANMLCSQREYDAAIRHYTRAIESDADFAEAYFNRGLTYIYTDQVEAGIRDLSKAGELGIYQAYNLISRLQ